HSQPAPTEDHIERIFVFAMMWSIGAFLEEPDRRKFHMYLSEDYSYLNLPPCMTDTSNTVFDYKVDDKGWWQHWETCVTDYVYPSIGTPDYHSILIPNVDIVRMDFLVDIAAKQGRHVMLVGEPGSAKTVIINAYMKNYDPEEHLCRNFTFSSASTPLYFQKIIEGFIIKRMGNTYGPPAGKTMSIFIDDINMPDIN
ncbi:unnamed protein product, partial [Meganyctiphanes norvegica]